MADIVTSRFGDLLRRHRQAAGLTQAELAERAGLSWRGLNDLERGVRRRPRRDTVALLATALRLSADDHTVFEAAARGSVERHAAAPDTTAAPTLPSGTVTFLFTDIEGSTRLLQELGATRYAEVLATVRHLLRAACVAHDGHEVDATGDSSFFTFAQAPDTLAAATDAQRALAAHAWSDGVTVRIRMGLHSGTAQLAGDHYIGLDVHRAARIAAAGHGGQVLLSRTTRDLVEHDLPEGVSLRELGAHRLKDLQRPEHLSQLVVDDLPTDFPPLATLEAFPNNLPIQPTALLGREREMTEIKDLLRRDGVRLLTLTGPGGTGKTRLGLQVAAELVDAFADGVWFVGLSRLTDPEMVIPTIAQTLGMRALASQPVAKHLREYLRPRRLLLVVDNCEQVAAAAPEIAELFEGSLGMKILATSRVALHLQGEHEYPVSPLALPAKVWSQGSAAHIERLLEAPAIALFVERARAHRPDFQMTAATVPAVAAICARLDGLPLAIGLAAARVKVLPPPQLLARMENRLPVLTGGARDLEARQQTMRNTLAWSEDLLGPAEQRLFRRLAVFVGGWTLEAAEAVCAAPEGAQPLGMDVLEGLERLVDHSLVLPGEMEDAARFRLLYVVREYALERLEASGEAEALRRAHAAYYLAFAERIAPDLLGVEFTERLRRMDPEADNFRAMLRWATDHQEGRLVGRVVLALAHFWRARAQMPDSAEIEQLVNLVQPGERGRGLDPDTAEPALPGPSADVPRAMAIAMQAVVFFFNTDWREFSPEARRTLTAHPPFARAIAQLEEAMAILRAAGSVPTLLLGLPFFGVVMYELGDVERAVALQEEGLALARLAGDHRAEAGVLQNMEEMAFAQGHYARAAELHVQSLPHLEAGGDETLHALSKVREAYLLWARSDVADAAARARAGLEQAHRIGYFIGVAEGLEVLAILLGDLGQPKRAARALGAAESLRASMAAGMGRSARPSRLRLIEPAIARMRTSMGDDGYEAAFEAGRTLPLDEAVADALAQDDAASQRNEQGSAP